METGISLDSLTPPASIGKEQNYYMAWGRLEVILDDLVLLAIFYWVYAPDHLKVNFLTYNVMRSTINVVSPSHSSSFSWPQIDTLHA